MCTFWQRRPKICTVITLNNDRIMRNTLSAAVAATHTKQLSARIHLSAEKHSVCSRRWWQEALERRRGAGSPLGHFCDRHSSLIHASVWHLLKSEGQQRNWLRDMLKINQRNKHSHGKRSLSISHDCKPHYQQSQSSTGTVGHPYEYAWQCKITTQQKMFCLLERLGLKMILSSVTAEKVPFTTRLRTRRWEWRMQNSVLLWKLSRIDWLSSLNHDINNQGKAMREEGALLGFK